MLSDDLTEFFLSKGYFLPAHGLPVVRLGRPSGEPQAWQITLRRDTGVHVFEVGFSALEAISQMVVRVSKASPMYGEHSTGQMEALKVGLAGFCLALMKRTSEL